MGGNAAIKALERRHKKKHKPNVEATQKAVPATKRLDAAVIGIRNPSQHIPVIRIDTIDAPCGSKLQAEVISDQKISLDLKKAMEYINLPIFPGEREVSDAQVQFLFDHMRQGTFNWSNTQLATILYNGVTYKGNGQHCSWATAFMCEVQKGFVSPAQVHEINYKVRNEEQMKLLYTTFDRNKVRGDAHINKVLLIGHDVIRGIHLKLLNKIISGVTLFRWPTRSEQDRLVPEHKAAYIEQIPGLFRAVSFFLQDKCKDSPLVWRQGIIAAMFATFEKTVQKAPEFWEPVATGLGLTKETDPRNKLRNWLMQMRVSGGGNKRSGTTIGPEGMYMVCLAQWNRWRKGETTQTVRALDEIPRVV